MFARCQLLLVTVILLSARGFNCHSELNGRIIGGLDVPIEAAPWQASLQMRGRHFCGGAIYSKDIIVTAAHCVAEKNLRYLSVRVGTSNCKIGGSVIAVSAMKVHEQYSKAYITSDVAVLLLKTPLVLSDHVVAIPLARAAPTAGAVANVSGWGMTERIGRPDLLQSVDVDIVAPKECYKLYKGFQITRATICAASIGKDACQGDSGGPLVHDGKLVGVVSWGYGCALPKYPGVYANVAWLHDWIVRAATALTAS